MRAVLTKEERKIANAAAEPRNNSAMDAVLINRGHIVAADGFVIVGRPLEFCEPDGELEETNVAGQVILKALGHIEDKQIDDNYRADKGWVGVSVTNSKEFTARSHLLCAVEAKVRFYSFEPLLGRIPYGINHPYFDADWVIIGSQTQPVSHPEKAWAQEIIDGCDYVRRPVFVKEPLASHMGIKREEMP